MLTPLQVHIFNLVIRKVSNHKMLHWINKRFLTFYSYFIVLCCKFKRIFGRGMLVVWNHVSSWAHRNLRKSKDHGYKMTRLQYVLKVRNFIGIELILMCYPKAHSLIWTAFTSFTYITLDLNVPMPGHFKYFVQFWPLSCLCNIAFCGVYLLYRFLNIQSTLLTLLLLNWI